MYIKKRKEKKYVGVECRIEIFLWDGLLGSTIFVMPVIKSKNEGECLENMILDIPTLVLQI